MIATPQSESQRPFPTMTVLEYLDWEAVQDVRYEYLNGNVIAMTGGTLAHNDIAVNLLMVLQPPVRSQQCRINVADAKVKVSETSYRYPDVVVSCDPRDKTATQALEYPTLIIEVLSPGTESKDRGEKFKAYRKLASLQEYVLVASNEIAVECYRRQASGLWLFQEYGEGDRIHFESIDIKCDIEQLYESVPFA